MSWRTGVKQKLTTAVLLFALATPEASYAAEYVQVGVFANVDVSQQEYERLVREGFPVVERLIVLPKGRIAVLMLVGPYDRVDKARYQLNKLKEKGWVGILRHYAEQPPLLPSLEPPAPKKRPEIERPPELLEPVPKKEPVKPTPPKPIPKVILPGTPLPERAYLPIEKKFEQRWSGYVAVEGRHFREPPLYAGQLENTSSIVFQPEFYVVWREGDSSLTVTPFVRAGDKDEERNHADIREFMWLNIFDDWELRLGIDRVFWGVTESQHLVDIINQIDLVENPDGEDKLGQPMINLTRTNNWGTFDLYALPRFRERTFPGLKGRLRGPLVVDSSQTQYESPDKDHHLDWAAHWSRNFGNVDLGLSYFSGTARAPNFVVGVDGTGQPVLIPRYDLLDQTGLTVQAIAGDWAWKLEAISAHQLKIRYFAMTGGFEYTHVGVFDSAMDLGLLAEYLYDDRGDNAPAPFANDLMVGLRWVFNDVQSSEVLFAVIHDLDGSTNNINLEASRRLGQHWKLSLEYRGNNAVGTIDVLYPIRMDDYVQLELARYF